VGISIHHGARGQLGGPSSRDRDMTESGLILKRAPIVANVEDYDVLCGGDVVGRIFLSQAAPQDRPMDVDAGLRAA
jgi:hypothetical protein